MIKVGHMLKITKYLIEPEYITCDQSGTHDNSQDYFILYMFSSVNLVVDELLSPSASFPSTTFFTNAISCIVLIAVSFAV